MVLNEIAIVPVLLIVNLRIDLNDKKKKLNQLESAAKCANQEAADLLEVVERKDELERLTTECDQSLYGIETKAIYDSIHN